MERRLAETDSAASHGNDKSEVPFLPLFLRAFAKADAGPTAVLVDEFDAGQLKRPSKQRYCPDLMGKLRWTSCH